MLLWEVDDGVEVVLRVEDLRDEDACEVREFIPLNVRRLREFKKKSLSDDFGGENGLKTHAAPELPLWGFERAKRFPLNLLSRLTFFIFLAPRWRFLFAVSSLLA